LGVKNKFENIFLLVKAKFTYLVVYISKIARKQLVKIFWFMRTINGAKLERR